MPPCCSSLRHRQPQLATHSSFGPSASTNAFDINPLAFAAWRGDAARVAALLEQPAALQQLHLRDKEHWSCLHFAVRGGSPVCIRLLAQAGADVHAVVPGGRQPIHWAAAAASADCCAELLLAGALPTAADSMGRTAVQLAQQRLQHELAAEEQAPFQRTAGALTEARKVLALLQAAAGGRLPIPSQLPLADSSPAADAAPPAAASDAAPGTPQLASRAVSCATLSETASVAGSTAAEAAGGGGGEPEGQHGTASSSGAAEAGAATASAARRECRVCLQEGQELLALIPCGHRVACASCCARLLLPGIMARLAAAAEGAAAADGAAIAGGEACRCPVCRAEVRVRWIGRTMRSSGWCC